MLTLAMATTGAVDPCTAGIAEANLLVRGVTFLKGQQQGQTTTDGTPQAPKTLQVSLATSTLFVGYGDGFQALTFPAGEGGDPTVQTMGSVPTNVPAGVWDWVLAATQWIHADVSFDEDAQRSILVPNAHCFGQSGSDAIVDGNMELSKTVAFAVPHTVQLDLANNVIVWDFDVIDRATCTVSGRGTDFVRLCSTSGQVYRVDTVRHQDGAQPDWVQTQLGSNFTQASATCSRLGPSPPPSRL